MDGKSAFKRGPWKTLKILISAWKHSAEHFIVKPLQGVAWDELLIRISLYSVLPTLISWEWVWAGHLFRSFTARFVQVGRRGPPTGACVSGSRIQGPEHTVGEKGRLGFAPLRSGRKPVGMAAGVRVWFRQDPSQKEGQGSGRSSFWEKI